MMARLVAILGLLAFGALQAADRPLIVGYLPEYRLATVTPAQLSGVTDLILFSIAPTAEGRLPEPPMSAGVLARYRQATTTFKGRRLIAVGGWGRSAGFARLSADRAAREAFIRPLLAFCRTNGFDGVDYDWEHPKDLKQLHNYAALLAETKTLAGSDKFLVTVAQAGWQILPKRAYAVVDRVHLMAYDHSFPQATYQKAVRECEELVNRWCPPRKAVLGIPFYGRNEAREALTYAEIRRRFPEAAHGDLAGGYAFNGPVTIRRKLEYIRRRGLGGVMIWELGQDSSGPDALLPVIVRQLRAAPGSGKAE